MAPPNPHPELAEPTDQLLARIQEAYSALRLPSTIHRTLFQNFARDQIRLHIPEEILIKLWDINQLATGRKEAERLVPKFMDAYGGFWQPLSDEDRTAVQQALLGYFMLLLQIPRFEQVERDREKVRRVDEVKGDVAPRFPRRKSEPVSHAPMTGMLMSQVSETNRLVGSMVAVRLGGAGTTAKSGFAKECPVCLEKFRTADEVQFHFDKEHPDF